MKSVDLQRASAWIREMECSVLFVAFEWTTGYTVAKLQPERENDMQEKVEKALEKVRPMLQRDGGNVELVAVEGDVVKVRLMGACRGCPMSQMTLKAGIERVIKQQVPEISEVVAVS